MLLTLNSNFRSILGNARLKLKKNYADIYQAAKNWNQKFYLIHLRLWLESQQK